MKTYKIDVRQEFIDAGIQGNPCECPIAKACFADHALRVRVGPESVRRFSNGIVATLPEKAIKFVEAFDTARETAKPFQFEITL